MIPHVTTDLAGTTRNASFRRQREGYAASCRRVKAAFRWFGLLIVLLAIWPGRCMAQSGSQREYELKAGLLYHIIGYVDWPEEGASNSSPTIQVGLIGQLPFADALEVLDGKTIKGRKVAVKRISEPQAASGCQVLFIGASERDRLAQLVGDLKDRPVLTVSEVDGFAEKGGMVNLVAGPNRIVMEVNREAAGKAHLGISSQLLRHAKVFPK
jgi:hypothetical protein